MIVEAMPPKERMWMIFKDLWDKGSESSSKSDDKKAIKNPVVDGREPNQHHRNHSG